MRRAPRNKPASSAYGSSPSTGLVSEVDFVVDLCFGGQLLGRDIQRDPGLDVRLVLREPFLQQRPEFRELRLQVAHGLGLQGQQADRRHGFGRGRAR